MQKQKTEVFFSTCMHITTAERSDIGTFLLPNIGIGIIPTLIGQAVIITALRQKYMHILEGKCQQLDLTGTLDALSVCLSKWTNSPVYQRLRLWVCRITYPEPSYFPAPNY